MKTASQVRISAENDPSFIAFYFQKLSLCVSPLADALFNCGNIVGIY